MNRTIHRVRRRATGACGERSRRAGSGGFTLVELLVVLAVLGLSMALGLPMLQNYMVRSRTEGFARESAILMQRTRLEAIKANRPGAVFVDPDRQELIAFVDRNGDGAFADGDTGLGRLRFPSTLSLGGPEGDSAGVDGLTSLGAGKGALFQPDGSVNAIGAFRFADERENYLEIRVEPAGTGRVRIRKWQDGRWLLPPSPDGTEGVEPWEWK